MRDRRFVLTVVALVWAFLGGLLFGVRMGERLQRQGDYETTFKAWEKRNDLEENSVLSEGCKIHPGESFTDGGVACKQWLATEQANPHQYDDIQWENFKKDIQNFPHSEDIIEIQMSKTSDTDAWVISLVGDDGKQMSYWLDSGDATGGKVQSISPY